MSLNPITKTAGDIATYVKRQFGDESGVQITDADIFRWINAAQLEIVSRVAPIKAKATNDIVAGQSDYSLATLNIHQIESIHYNKLRLTNMPFAEAERLIISPEQTSDTPSIWYEWAGVVTLWPTPSSSIVGGLTIYYTGTAVTVTVSTDPLSLPDKYFEAIVAWILSKAFELDEEFDASNNQRTFFNDRLSEQNGEESESAHMTYPTITFVED